MFITATACNKSAITFQNNGLSGKWQLTEYFISPGDGGSWHLPGNSTERTIEFYADKSFKSSDSAYGGAIGYNIIDSNRMEFILPTQVSSTLECYYEVKDNGATLILSPVGCIEGCSDKYKAVKNNSRNSVE